MPFCVQCGSELDEGARFCTQCGTAVRDDAPDDSAKPESDNAMPNGEAEQADESALPEAPHAESDETAVLETPWTADDMSETEPLAAVATPESDADQTVAFAETPWASDETAQLGAVAAPVMAPIAAPESATPSETDNAPAPRKSRKKPILISAACVAALAVIVAGAVAFSPLGETALQSAADSVSAVHYGSSDTAKVRPSTHIIAYDENGNPLHDFDLTVTDAEGNESMHHITGDRFTPEDLGLAEGTYNMTVTNPETGKTQNLPPVEVVPPTQGGDIPDELPVKPSGNPDTSDKPNAPETSESDANKGEGNSETTTDAAGNRQKAYQLYYDKLAELQEEYGEVETKTDGSMTYLDGFCTAFLTDFNEDGTEELVTVGYDESKQRDDFPTVDPSAYVVTVWGYDDETSSLEEKATGGASSSNGGYLFVPFLATDEEDLTLVLDETTYDDTHMELVTDLVGKTEDGDVGVVEHRECSAPLSPSSSEEITYAIDGEPVTKEDWFAMQESEYEAYQYIRLNQWDNEASAADKGRSVDAEDIFVTPEMPMSDAKALIEKTASALKQALSTGKLDKDALITSETIAAYVEQDNDQTDTDQTAKSDGTQSAKPTDEKSAN